MTLALVAVALVALATAGTASAAHIKSVKAVYDGKNSHAKFIVLIVKASGADAVLVKWKNKGGGYSPLTHGQVGMAFRNAADKSFKVKVAACNNGRCGHFGVFKGKITARPRPAPPPQTGGDFGGPGQPGGPPGPELPIPPVEIIPLPPIPAPLPPLPPPPFPPFGL